MKSLPTRVFRQIPPAIWVLGFGIQLTPMMIECAGADHAFAASDASELNEAFSKIATTIGDLRIDR